MTAAHAVDIAALVLAAVGPVLFVLRWPRLGIALGAVHAWLVLIVAGEILARLDPARGATVTDGAWIVLGWIATLAYAGVVHVTIRAIAAVARMIKARAGRAPGA